MDASTFTKSLVLVLCEVLYSIAGTVDYDLNSNHITIRCKPNEKFAVLPTLNASVTPNTVAVYDCELPDIPEHTYKSEFQRLNISIENLKTLYLQGNETTLSAVLKVSRSTIDTYFRGLSAITGKLMGINNTTYFTYTLTEEKLLLVGHITVKSDTIDIACLKAGSLPTVDHIQTPTHVMDLCDPTDSYSAMFNRVIINLSKVKTFITRHDAQFSPSYLIGLPNGTIFDIRLEDTAAAIHYSGKLNEKDSVLNIVLSDRGEYPPLPPDMKTLTSKLSNLTYKHLVVTGMESEENLNIADLVYPITSNIGEINKVTLRGDMDIVNCLPERLFTNISLKSLVVNPQGIRENPTNIMYGIPVESSVFNSETLTTVYLKHVKIPELPKSNNLANITLDHSESEGTWGGCRKLKRLALIRHSFGRSFGPNLLEENGGWLAHCEQLTELVLSESDFSDYWSEDGKLIDILNIIITGLKSVKKLIIVNCSLEKLADNFFAHLSNIEYIDLTGNELQYPNFISGISETIHTLIMDDNPFLPEAAIETYLGKFKNSIKHISLRGRGPTEEFGPRSLIYGDFTNLTYLDLSNNVLSGNFTVDHLPSNTKLPVLVDLRNTSILSSSHATCNDWSYHHRRLLQAKNVTVLMSWTVPCDCSIGCLALQMSSLPSLNITGVTCEENSQRLDRGMLANIDTFQCKKYLCGECTCRQRWRDDGTVAWCGALELRELPAALRDERNLVEIHAPGNAISRLRADDIPSTLKVLDLRNNSIISADAAAATMLFSDKGTKILLAGSTVDCGCDEENLPWLTALLENIKQVEDYQTVSCSEYTKGLLKNLNINELCVESWTGWPLVASLALIFACAIAAGFIVKLYQKQIRVFLFIHGLCLSCVQEEDLDADKQYDIFISFCHEDDDFVMDEIVPKLSMYNLCIHYRDWLAGEWIPAQIARSVHDSRRTIIVMSKSFLRSSWGLMEFRMAHAATAEKGRAKVIIVLREEVFDVPELDAELRCYLATNTYVKWGDPWFFEKLRYGLPREPNGQREELASDGDEFRMAVNVYRRDDGETTR